MWRRVAAQSPEDVPANASEKAVGSRYLKAWDALSALLTQGQSLSGLERNCLYLNTHKDKFANVSSVTGFDFPSDSRGLAAVDWDHDGDLDVWQSNRTSPRIRFLRNETIDDARKEETERAGHWIAFRLEISLHFGDKSQKTGG